MKNLFLTFLILSSCGTRADLKVDLFEKKSLFSGKAGESTPFVMNEKLYYMTSTMTKWNQNNTGEILIYNESQKLVSKTSVNFSLGSAIVDNETLYVIGSRDWHKRENSFYIISTSDLKNWTNEREIIKADKDTTFYNNSTTKVGNKFIMSYEYCKDGEICFQIAFKESIDLVNWTSVGEKLSINKYTACPTLKFSDGFFYLFYAEQIPRAAPACETYFVRSKDLKTWSKKALVLSPLSKDKNDAICDSDFDFVEYKNKLFGIYLEGNQKTWFRARLAQFNGTTNDLTKAIKWD